MGRQLDRDGSGEVEKEEFESIVFDPRILYYFRKIGVHIEPDTASSFFDLLDFDASGKINLDEFVMACSNFGGSARAIDLVRMQSELRKLRRTIAQLTSRPSRSSRLGNSEGAHAE